LTYNIRIGLGSREPELGPYQGLKRPIDLAPVIAAIRSTGADVVALQEVLGDAQAGKIAEALGMEYRYARHGPKYGKWWGLAILSRLPILFHEGLAVSTGAGNTRSDLLAQVAVGGRRLTIVNTHVDTDLADGAPQRKTMANIEGISGPLVLLGDFNARPKAKRLDVVRARQTDVTETDATDAEAARRHSTFRHDRRLVKGKRIDYIFVDTRRVRVAAVGLLDRAHWDASDHLGVHADISIREP